MKKIIFVLMIMFIGLVNVKAGSITVSRRDKENKIRLEATLVGSRIELYKNNCMINSKVIDESGVVVFENLEDGKYGIKQGNAKGYKQDILTYDVYSYGEFENKEIILTSSVVEGNLIINKYIDETIDKNAVFEIYHGNNLIKTLKYENGSIKGVLEYGTYLIKQVNGSKYYNYVDDFNVTIKHSSDYTFDLYSDMDSELKILLENQENNLNIKESELLKKENDLNNIELNLENKRLELLEKEEVLINLENEINIKDEKIKQEYIILKEKEANLNKRELEFLSLKENFDIDKNVLIELENSINKEKEEILILKEVLTNKINENKKDEVLVVEVPNTSKRNYKRYISLSLIVLGSLIIIYKIKKLLI